jgi:hypothetical protein
MIGKDKTNEKVDVIRENTLIPISIAALIASAIFGFGQLYSRVENDGLRIDKVQAHQDGIKSTLQQILQSVARIEERLEKRK